MESIQGPFKFHFERNYHKHSAPGATGKEEESIRTPSLH